MVCNANSSSSAASASFSTLFCSFRTLETAPASQQTNHEDKRRRKTHERSSRHFHRRKDPHPHTPRSAGNVPNTNNEGSHDGSESKACRLLCPANGSDAQGLDVALSSSKQVSELDLTSCQQESRYQTGRNRKGMRNRWRRRKKKHTNRDLWGQRSREEEDNVTTLTEIGSTVGSDSGRTPPGQHTGQTRGTEPSLMSHVT